MPAKAPICEHVTAGELARVLGVSRKHVYDLLKRGMPRDGRLFDLAQCVQWQLQQFQGDKQGSAGDVQEARLRLYEEQTRKLELENAKLRGTHVDIEEARSVLLSLASVVAGQLDALGPRLAPVIVGCVDVGEVQDVIFTECRELRRAIAGEIERLDPHGGEDDHAAAAEDGGPVGGRKEVAASRKSRTRKVANKPDPILRSGDAPVL